MRDPLVAPAPSRRGRTWSDVRGVGLILPLSLLLAWEATARNVPNSIAPPSDVLVAFGRLLADGSLLSHVLWSVGRLLIGFAIGATFALTLGALVGLSIGAERLISPTVQLLAPIPIVAWIPLIILLLKIGEAPKIAIIAVGTFFVVFASTVLGIRGVDAKLIEVARVYGKPASVLVRRVLLPAAMPSIMAGLHVALGLSWILLLVAEQIATSRGIGWLMWDARTFGRSTDLIATMISVGILGKLSDLLLTVIERRILRWRRAFEGQ